MSNKTATTKKTTVTLANTFTETDWLECQRFAQYATSKLRTRYKLTPDEVEDLVSEGCIAAIGALRTWEPNKGAKSTWLLSRVNGELIDQISALRHAGLTGTDLTGVRIVGAIGPTSDASETAEGVTNKSLNWEDLLGSGDDYESNEKALAIAIAVEQLPSADRRLIEDYYGLSGIGATKTLRAIGASLGCSGELVRLRINRILSDLSK